MPVVVARKHVLNLAAGPCRLSSLPCFFPQVWRFISTQLLEPSHPMELHQALLAATYQGWPVEELGPPPVSGFTAARPGRFQPDKVQKAVKESKCRFPSALQLYIPTLGDASSTNVAHFLTHFKVGGRQAGNAF